MYLDFSKPKLLDSERIVSSPTPNLSNLKIEADNELWVAGVSEAVFGVLANKKTQYGLLHRAFSYDFGMLILGLPFGLYMAWKLSGFVQSKLGIIHDVLSATAYIYIVVAALWLYRLLFGYTKWAFPTVELKENSSASGKHRVFWYTILVGLLVNFIFEFSK